MDKLVNGLAYLCSLRDRDALDGALVSVIFDYCGASAGAVRLVQLLPTAASVHVLMRAERLAGAPGCERRLVWAEAADLPILSPDSLVARCAATGFPAVDEGTPYRVVFPIGNAPTPSTLLEIEMSEAPADHVIGVVQGVLQLYTNFESLLDYGERDALTELLNRKTFVGAFFKAAQAQAALAQAPAMAEDRRRDNPDDGYWLAVLDIDHFKRVNDNFGHLIGDEVLLLMARLMRAHFRYQDQLYRFGGEEFVVLMRCGSHDDAASALARFRAAVEAFAFPQVGTITVSIGFAGLTNDDTPGGAFDRADKAVYYAKEHGRNQVCSYQKLVDSGELIEADTSDNDIDFF